MNELANLADQLGADIELVRQGVGSDPRIGYSFLYAGTGYGGSCFPKDVDALCRTAAAHGQNLRILESVQAVNRTQRHVLLDKIFARFGSDLVGCKFAVFGLAFKPGTDDMREAPSRDIVAGLLRAGASVVAHDPVAQAQAHAALREDLGGEGALLDRLSFVDKPMDAVAGADALVLVTEWKNYRSPNLAALKKSMRTALVFDGRNLYDPHQFAAAGITCIGIGRNNLDILRAQEKTAAAPAVLEAAPQGEPRVKKRVRAAAAN
jgi:UDPglucose 6-dehydrogenase